MRVSTPEDCAKRFSDDPSIAEGTALLRRVPPRHFFLDENLGRLRPSSAAFEDDEDGDPMSVYRQDIIDAEGGNARRVLAGHEGYGLASLLTGEVRSKNQTVHTSPLPAEPSHASVCGPKPKSTCRWFAKQAVWVVNPPGG